jgi:hypothetical protein
MRFVLALVFALLACHRETQPAHPKPGDLPPLPPASGTPVGYIIDASSELKLRDDQLKQLQDIDASLAAKDAEIDTELRQIEKPEEEEPEPKGGGGGHRPHKSHAPGVGIKSNSDATKLHQIRDAQDRDALKKAWTVLDKDQQDAAAKILTDHDVEVPGQKKQQAQTSDEGQPLPGMEP